MSKGKTDAELLALMQRGIFIDTDETINETQPMPKKEKLSPTQQKVYELAQRPQGVREREPAMVIGRGNGMIRALAALEKKGLVERSEVSPWAYHAVKESASQPAPLYTGKIIEGDGSPRLNLVRDDSYIAPPPDIGLINAEKWWRKEDQPRPVVVCLCGSTRFSEAYQQANLHETLAGRIVLTIGCDMKSDAALFDNKTAKELETIKRDLDALHLRKIDLADEVLILNVGGYVGDSTRREIAYAALNGKAIRWLEPDRALDITQR